MPLEERNLIWRENLDDPKKMLLAREGWIGLAGFHFAFIYVWTAIIMFFQARLINRNKKIHIGFKSIHNRRLLSFIIMISLLYLPLFIPGIFGILFNLAWFNAGFISFTHGISLTAIAIYLLIYPNVLYGFLPEKKFIYTANTITTHEKQEDVSTSDQTSNNSAVQTETLEKTATEVDASLPDPDYAPELAIVLQHMLNEKPFLKQGFSIQDLSTQTGIPVYQLSPLINRHFKMNFTSWINRYRIEYFIENAPKNPNMTLEAHAKDAGFASRTKFISAFKKEKGVTPSEYIKAMS
jgi:AraC-like DNA-binding protein